MAISDLAKRLHIDTMIASTPGSDEHVRSTAHALLDVVLDSAPTSGDSEWSQLRTLVVTYQHRKESLL